MVVMSIFPTTLDSKVSLSVIWLSSQTNEVITWANPVWPVDQIEPVNLTQERPGGLTGPAQPTMPLSVGGRLDRPAESVPFFSFVPLRFFRFADILP